MEDLLKFEGFFSFNLIEKFIATLKCKMENIGTETLIKKKIINIVVECLENIHKHEDIEEAYIGDKRFEIKFSVAKNETAYYISAGNPIENKNIDNVKQKIETVNCLDKEGLKKKYEDIILAGQISPKNGAGLGLIDIALKSGHKLECKFETIDEKYSYYTINIKVAKKN